MDREDYLKAVDNVCMNCMFSEDTCVTCPVRQMVDNLYDFAPYEIWIAWEEEESWTEQVKGTKKFKDDNVDACFQFSSFDTFYDTLQNLVANPIASWYWVFIFGKPVVWGAMSDSDIDTVYKYAEELDLNQVNNQVNERG